MNAAAAAPLALRATRPSSLRSEGPVDAAGPAGAIDGANGRAANSPLEGGQRTPPSTGPWKPGKRPPAFHSAHKAAASGSASGNTTYPARSLDA